MNTLQVIGWIMVAIPAALTVFVAIAGLLLVEWKEQTKEVIRLF